MNLRTGSELESASTHGNAEAQECAKARDCAMVMMLVRKSMNEHDEGQMGHAASFHPLIQS